MKSKIKQEKSWHNTNDRVSGFVLLFAVVLTAIILSVALGISNITFRELTFSTSATASNQAFYAADVGVECALYYDLGTVSGGVYVFSDEASEAGVDTIECFGQQVNVGNSFPDQSWTFIIPNQASSGSCVIVTLSREGSPETTTIVSQGYNIGDQSCQSTDPNRVERVIEVTY